MGEKGTLFFCLFVFCFCFVLFFLAGLTEVVVEEANILKTREHLKQWSVKLNLYKSQLY